MQAMLKEIVDETSRGQYDFMYLRIGWYSLSSANIVLTNFVDFANNCKLVTLRHLALTLV